MNCVNMFLSYFLAASVKEGDRLLGEASSLANIKLPSDDPNEPGIEIQLDGYPTLTDGKTKNFWTKCTRGFKQCTICSATGVQLGKDLRGM